MNNFKQYIPIFILAIFLVILVNWVNSDTKTSHYKYLIQDKNGNSVYANTFTIKGDSVLVPLSTGDTIRMGKISNIKTL